MRTILVTGTAGFIGYHLAVLLLTQGFRVVGYDGMTEYYDIRIKQRRHQMLLQNPNFTCVEGMLASSAPYLCVMDGDLQHDETILPDCRS